MDPRETDKREPSFSAQSLESHGRPADAIVVDYEVHSSSRVAATYAAKVGISELPQHFQIKAWFGPEVLRIDYPFQQGFSTVRRLTARGSLPRGGRRRQRKSSLGNSPGVVAGARTDIGSGTRLVRTPDTESVLGWDATRFDVVPGRVGGELWLAKGTERLAPAAGEFVGELFAETRRRDVSGVPLAGRLEVVGAQSSVTFKALAVREAEASEVEAFSGENSRRQIDAARIETEHFTTAGTVLKEMPAAEAALFSRRRSRASPSRWPSEHEPYEHGLPSPSIQGEDFALVIGDRLLFAVMDAVNGACSHLGSYYGDGEDGGMPIHIEVDLWRDLLSWMSVGTSDGDATLLEFLRRGLTALFFFDWQISGLLTPSEKLALDYVRSALEASDRGQPIPRPSPEQAALTVGPSEQPLEAWLQNAIAATNVWTSNYAASIPLAVRAYLITSGSDRFLDLVFPDMRPPDLDSLVLDLLYPDKWPPGVPPLPVIAPLMLGPRIAEIEQAGVRRILEIDLQSDTSEIDKPAIGNLIHAYANDFDTSLRLGNPLISELKTGGGGVRMSLNIQHLRTDFYWSTSVADTTAAKILAAMSMGAFVDAVSAEGFGVLIADDSRLDIDIYPQANDDGTDTLTSRVRESSELDLRLQLVPFELGRFGVPSPSVALSAAVTSAVASFTSVVKTAVLGLVEKLLNERLLPQFGAWVQIWHAYHGPSVTRSRVLTGPGAMTITGQLALSDALWGRHRHSGFRTTKLWAFAYGVSEEYLSSWLRTCLGPLSKNQTIDDLDWATRLGSTVPGFKLPDTETLPVPASCDDDVARFDRLELARSPMTETYRTSMAAGFSEGLDFAEVARPAARSPQNVVRTILTRTLPVVAISPLGQQTAVGHMRMPYEVSVTARRTLYRSRFGGIVPAQCRLVARKQFDFLVGLSQGVPDRDMELVVARRLNQPRFTPQRLPRGLIATLSGPGSEASSSRPELPGLIPRLPEPSDWSHGSHAPGEPDPQDLMIVCQPPRAVWSEREFDCVLRTYVEAHAEITADLYLGFKVMNLLEFLPTLVISLRNIQVSTELVSVADPFDQLAPTDIAQAVADVVREDFSILVDALADSSELTWDMYLLSQRIPRALEALSLGNNRGTVDALNAVSELIHLSGGSPEVAGRFVYWPINFDQQVSSLFN